MRLIQKNIQGSIKPFLLFCILFGLYHLAVGQDKYHLTVVVSPSMEKISDRKIKQRLPLEWKPSYHLGVEYKGFLDPDFSFTTGINFQNKGFRTRPVNMTTPGVFDTSKSGHIIVSARYITVPFGLDKHFQVADRTWFLVSGALHGGYLFNQVFNGRRFDGPDEIQDPLFRNVDKDGSTPIYWFRKAYFAWSAGAGIVQYIKAKGVISAQLMYQRQLNNNIDPDGPVLGTEKPRFDAIYLNLKAGYYFNKQIKNYKKSL